MGSAFANRQRRIEKSELSHEARLPDVWHLLAMILQANSKREILKRDDLMVKLAALTGKGIEVRS